MNFHRLTRELVSLIVLRERELPQDVSMLES